MRSGRRDGLPMQRRLKRRSESLDPASTWIPSDWMMRFTAGGTAGLIDAAVLTPLERTQTLMQMRAKHLADGAPRRCSAGSLSSSEALAYVGRHGWREFYRGLGCAATRNSLCNGSFFTLLPHCRTGFHRLRDSDAVRATKPDSLLATVVASKRAEDFMCGVGLGTALSVFVFPMSTVMKRLQMEAGTAHLSMGTAVREIVAERGHWTGVYRGLPAYMVRSALAWGVTNSVYSFFEPSAL